MPFSQMRNTCFRRLQSVVQGTGPERNKTHEVLRSQHTSLRGGRSRSKELKHLRNRRLRRRGRDRRLRGLRHCDSEVRVQTRLEPARACAALSRTSPWVKKARGLPLPPALAQRTITHECGGNTVPSEVEDGFLFDVHFD